MTSARAGTTDPLEFLGALAILGIMLLLVAWLFLPEFVYWSCFILHILWGMADFGPFHTWAAPRYNLLAVTANNAEYITYDQWINVMEQTTGILMIFLIPCPPLPCGAGYTIQHATGKRGGYSISHCRSPWKHFSCNCPHP
jgi:intracellular multiplication protein IcmP